VKKVALEFTEKEDIEDTKEPKVPKDALALKEKPESEEKKVFSD